MLINYAYICSCLMMFPNLLHECIMIVHLHSCNKIRIVVIIGRYTLLTHQIKGSNFGITYISHHISCLEVVWLVSFADLAWYNLDISLATTFLVVLMSFHLYLLMFLSSQFFYLMVLGMQIML